MNVDTTIFINVLNDDVQSTIVITTFFKNFNSV